MGEKEFWTKVFVAAIGGAAADPNVQDPVHMAGWAEKVADAAMDLARDRDMFSVDTETASG